MKPANILCEKRENNVLTDLFENMSDLLQDSDAVEEKELIKNSLRKMTDNTTYIILGNEGVGKTSLLQVIFQNIMTFPDDFNGALCEYRWGEQEVMTPVADGMYKQFVTSENMKGISVIDTKGVDVISDVARETMRQQIERSSAVFVVFDSENIRSPKLWDLIEGCPEKRMIFILTKCGLIPEESLEQNIRKMKIYMQECGVSAPLFAVNVAENEEIPGTVSPEYVRAHVSECVIGKNPMLFKQMENIQEMKKVLGQLRDSFAMRKKQYASDYKILQKINQSMDSYVLNHKEFLSKFIKELKIEINKDIDNYENEIISKLDPHKIKERFRNKEDFQDYLTMVNENYKTLMSDSVNRKTIEAIKSCLRDLEIVFQEAVGYFNTRESILALNDKFYGSLSTGRKQMVDETKGIIVTTGELYRTLSDASETLFMQIWEARKKYETVIQIRKNIATGGAVAGAALGCKAGIALTTALKISGTATLGPAMLCIVVGFIVGAAVINSIAKTICDPINENKLEETTQKCIEEFKAEVNRTRIQMINQITAQITEIFEKELATVDSCFAEFRMCVNIDERKIPMLEQRLHEVENLLEKLETI